MKVLVACEESQTVTKAFRKLGHEAYSCDIQECSGGHPEWHLMRDVTELLAQTWDAVIAFPPCTYLTSAQAGWYNVDKYGQKAIDRRKMQEEGIAFFELFTKLNHVSFVSIENPVGIMSSRYRKPDQIVQPWMFGDRAQKTTCLWLKGLPKLAPTNIVDKGDFVENKRKDGRTERRPIWFKQGEAWSMTQEERSRARSKTFQGIADAMAAQWGGVFAPCGAST